MHRFRSWTLDPPEWRTQRNRILAVEGGDGSTLSLDFTTGILDPRLTLTRGTNATFINSQGYVEWAAANALSNSVFAGASGATQPTGWLVSFVGGTGSFTLNGTELTISNNGSATRSRIYQTGPTGNGLPVTVQLKVVANNTSGMGLVELLSFSVNGYVSGSQQVYKVNGITQTSSFTGWVAGDTVTLTCIPATGSAATCLFGVGVSLPVSTSASVTIKDVQIEPGSVARSYIATTTSGAYQAPRFDYDPTTTPPTPRGLLIEGSASNLWTYSQDQSQWALNNVTVNTGTQATAPDGATSLFPVLTSTTSAVQYFVRQRSADTISATSGQTYTYSMFVKKGTHRYVQMFASATTIFTTPAQANFDLDDGTTGNVTNCTPNAVSYSNGWWRLSITVTANQNASQAQPFIMYLVSSKTAARSEVHSLTSASVYVWGAQVEAGSGASSYIPTGASTGNRAEDVCVMDNITSLQYSNTNGSMYYEGRFSKLNTSSFPWRMGFTTESGDYRVFGLLTNSAGSSVEAKGPSATPTATVSVSLALNTNYKLAWSMDTALSTGELRRSSNGGAVSVSSASALTVTGTPTYFMFGQKGYGLFFPAGTIKAAKYWPTTLPDAQLQALTTG
jgi:hypothetical protein